MSRNNTNPQYTIKNYKEFQTAVEELAELEGYNSIEYDYYMWNREKSNSR